MVMRRVAIGANNTTQNVGIAVLLVLVVTNPEKSRTWIALNHLIDQRVACPTKRYQSKLESGAHLPASELAEAERKLGQTLAARSFLEPVGDSREMSAA
jgi:hypothetical protein